MAAHMTDKPTKATREKSRRELVADLTAMQAQFNALLTKLDNDGGVTDADYFDTLQLATPSTTL